MGFPKEQPRIWKVLFLFFFGVSMYPILVTIVLYDYQLS